MRNVAALLIALLLAAPAQASYLSTSNLPIYDTSGNLKTPSHTVVGSCTLTLGVCSITLSGTAVFTSATTYFCASSDQSLTSAAASWITNTSGTAFTVNGILSHVINFNCMGW